MSSLNGFPANGEGDPHEGIPLEKAKHILLLERDLSYMRLCVGNIVGVHHQLEGVALAKETCPACKIALIGKNNTCENHKAIEGRLAAHMDTAIRQCYAAVENRTGEQLNEYLQAAVARGQKAQTTLNAIDPNRTGGNITEQ